MNSTPEPSNGLVRRARIAQSLTAAWMIVELVASLAIGVAARSVALTTFGLDSGIELFTSLVVLRALVLRGEGADGGRLDARERQASRLIGLGLYGLIVYILVTSLVSLIGHVKPDASMPGVVLAMVVLCVMPVLWRWRLALARRLDSPALRSDCACSLVCIYMSATLLAGLLLNSVFGWWWADPIAGLAMVWWIRGEAHEALETAETGRREE